MHKFFFQTSTYLQCPKFTCLISRNLNLGLVISKLVVYLVSVLPYLVVLSWRKGVGGMVLWPHLQQH